MKMNRFILILAILNISYTLSQEGKMSFERLKAIKMTFITEKIGLNENEEAFFWRIYNDYEKKIYERSSEKIRSISSLEAYKAINQMNNLEHLALELKEKRDLKLLDSLSPNKVLKVQHAEYRFKREMIFKIIKKTNQEAEKQ
jgi:superfamily I DNA/RNA helicase